MAMLFDQLLEAVNNKSLPLPVAKKQWEEDCDRITVHAKGIRPRFKSPRKTKGHLWITPANYDVRYQYLFDDYILNRHPNEQIEHYYWRLSAFPLIAQEIYLNAKSQITGAIFQASQFTIKANDADDDEYLDQIEFREDLPTRIAEHVFTDPYGKFAVVESHYGEFGVTEFATPVIELVESRNILSYQEGVYILFQACEKYLGKRLLYYIDTDYCIKLVEGAETKDFEVLAYYQHGFKELPLVDNGTHFFQKFISWADMLARNISDDEVIAKNASYPHKQVIEPTCQKCMGQRDLQIQDDRSPTGYRLEQCDQCAGRGTISMNIGEVYVVRERAQSDARPIDDHVKFINPDISINEFSFKRWKEIYDFGMRSMHMKYVEEAQSGVAKAFDREQLYFLISNVSNKLFDIAEDLLRFILAYRHLKIESEQATHDFVQFIVERPQQFQIKTEYDIQAEYTDLVAKKADLFVRRSKLDEYMEKAFQGNPVALQKFNVIKNFDWLYGMADDELNTRKLLQSATTNDFIRHDRAQFILNGIEQDKGERWIVDTELSVILAEMEKRVAKFLIPDSVMVPGDVLQPGAPGMANNAGGTGTDNTGAAAGIFDNPASNDGNLPRSQSRQNG